MVATAQSESTRRDWWQWAVLAALIVFLYYDILARLTQQWIHDPNFSHGFFVPAFSAFVIWNERKRLAELEEKPSWWGAVFIALALCVLVVGVLGAELFLSRSSLVLLFGGLLIHFRGWIWFRALFFPWAFLFLMIPIPAIIFNQIAFPLQLLASKLASTSLALFGVPVLREGNVIHLPAMSLEVVEACSGIRSLMSLGTLAIIYGYFLESGVWRRVLLALGAIPIAVAANSLRIVGTGLLGQYWDPDKAQGFFHTFSGWLIFVMSLLLLFGLHGLLRLGERWLAARKERAAR
ncbi:MAG: exosortase [Acidobacteria bacterium]|nr:exosortase [Acidobacteriota bacterium]MBI3661939.1 exosortase [Acidobacteriota bacterium]